MASPAVDAEEIELEIPGFFRLHKTGRFERLVGTDKIPASFDPQTGVDSKDVEIDPITGVSARLYLPPSTGEQRLPLVVYFHGGAFCLESSASPIYHRFLNSLCSLAPLLVVSVDYRLAPEHPLPAAYDDSWTALRWALSRSDPWLADRADLTRVFLAGDSAGANIAHNMALRAAEAGVAIKGSALIHPYFWGSDPVGSESFDLAFRSNIIKIWEFLCPDTTGPDDHRLNPIAAGAPMPAVGRVLVTVAERDVLKHRGKAYFEKIVAGEDWAGEAELVETPDADHVFHLFHPDTEQAKAKIKLLADFFSRV